MYLAPSLGDACDAKAKEAGDLDRALAQSKRDLKLLTKQHKTQRPDLHVELVSRSLMALREGNLDAAQLYVKKLPAKSLRAWTVESWMEKLTAWWSTASKEMVECMTVAPVKKAERVACQTAKNFLRQQKLHDWVSAYNFDQRLAPSAAAMRSVSNLEDGGVVALFLKKGAQGKRAVFARLRRWRSRWGVCLGRIAERSVLTVEARRCKA